MSNMKQSTLNFAAAKRTASNSYAQAGKPKLSSTTVPKPKVTQPVTKVTPKKRDSSEDIDEYDDIVLKESSSEEIEEVEESSSVGTTAAKKKGVGDETLTRKTRLQTAKSLPLATTKPGKEKVVTASQPFKTSKLEPEDHQKKVEANETENESLPELDPSSRRWNQLHEAAKAKLGGVPVHGKDDNKVQQILRVFDNSSEYGPCVGMTRLERWERADSLGLNPPKEIHEILKTKQSLTLDQYKQSVFHDEV